VGCGGAAAADVSFHEPLRVTLVRTGLLALAVGFGAALLQRQPASWPQWTAFALWFTFGGHWSRSSSSIGSGLVSRRRAGCKSPHACSRGSAVGRY